jgi:hypothetical protein
MNFIFRQKRIKRGCVFKAHWDIVLHNEHGRRLPFGNRGMALYRRRPSGTPEYADKAIAFHYPLLGCGAYPAISVFVHGSLPPSYENVLIGKCAFTSDDEFIIS